ncbi:hypothetical protein BO71DRAFT_195304 [Aspergillus ellipticus CBS 707.79]|uniref:Uncharacterized protein n=1 Tax=Aspergillus ellipticus CBS 707.79 TaxID=1448320 RepID=A0A319DF86_9EURO|nr:hypothetical protein BO71DRAFT_195304 [Aspergillus ellipticus CBS 707.79]
MGGGGGGGGLFPGLHLQALPLGPSLATTDKACRIQGLLHEAPLFLGERRDPINSQSPWAWGREYRTCLYVLCILQPQVGLLSPPPPSASMRYHARAPSTRAEIGWRSTPLCHERAVPIACCVTSPVSLLGPACKGATESRLPARLSAQANKAM